MKKILALSLVTIMAAGSYALTAQARNSSGDGSVEDSYVEGQKAKAPIEKTDEDSKADNHFGDGSREDSYVAGQKKDSPESKTVIEDAEKGSSDDGTPRK